MYMKNDYGMSNILMQIQCVFVCNEQVGYAQYLGDYLCLARLHITGNVMHAVFKQLRRLYLSTDTPHSQYILYKI